MTLHNFPPSENGWCYSLPNGMGCRRARMVILRGWIIVVVHLNPLMTDFCNLLRESSVNIWSDIRDQLTQQCGSLTLWVLWISNNCHHKDSIFEGG